MKPTKIYCVLCPSYHGATLLSLLLGNHEKILSLGDTIPSRTEFTCGCRTASAQCEFWQKMRNLQPSGSQSGWPQVKPRIFSSPALNQAAIVAKALMSLKLGRPARFDNFEKNFSDYLTLCRDYYEFDIFIDGCKNISRYLTLKSVNAPVLGVIHIVRDPRSYVASAKRRNVETEQAAHQWNFVHKNIRRFTNLASDNVFRLRYEDFCTDPQTWLTKLQSFLNVPRQNLQVPIADNVHWTGNRTLFQFSGEIAESEKWKSQLTTREIELIRRISGPLAAKFDYDLSR